MVVTKAEENQVIAVVGARVLFSNVCQGLLRNLKQIKVLTGETFLCFIIIIIIVISQERGKMRTQAYSAHVPRTLNLTMMMLSFLTTNTRYP